MREIVMDHTGKIVFMCDWGDEEEQFC